jgi:hypothetical protein
MPSLLFIVGAYALFALCILWSRHQRNRYRSRRYGSRTPRLLLLSGSLLGLVCIIGLLVNLLPPPPHNPMHLTGVLKATEPGWSLVKAELPPEKLRLLHNSAGDQPVYALLHPETPPILVPEKPASPRGSSRRPRMKRPAAADAPRTIMSSRPTAQGKAAVKSRMEKTTITTAVKATLVHHAYSR